MGRANVHASNNWSEPSEVLVKAGDSLWNIAKGIPGGENSDIRKLVYEIRKVNGLSTSTLVPGQVLIIPVIVH